MLILNMSPKPHSRKKDGDFAVITDKSSTHIESASGEKTTETIPSRVPAKSNNISTPQSAKDRAIHKYLGEEKKDEENPDSYRIISLLPFPVKLLSAATGLNPDKPAHCFPAGSTNELFHQTATVESGIINGGLRIISTREECSGLPDANTGILYLVSKRIRKTFPHRTDLISPGIIVRNGYGTILGCLRLERNAPINPAINGFSL